ncbi:MAG: type II toxin-antitoxin system RelB/DinJ family antitoxin [Magnetococcales bacterium]|nr:type II toxin-antitoxin system RelB/DinJ family antitoxin [Magnetococcales bacterium]
MAKRSIIRARIEPSVKNDAEAILQALGISATEAITLFYRQVVMHRGLPFLIKLPNETTRNAMQDALAGQHLTEWENLEDLRAKYR